MRTALVKRVRAVSEALGSKKEKELHEEIFFFVQSFFSFKNHGKRWSFSILERTK